MKRIMKSAAAVILTMLIAVAMLPVSYFTGIIKPTTASAATSGTCGDNLTWTLDDAGTLTISGTGKMTDYKYILNRVSPWYGIRGSIKNVLIDDGVTSIGGYAFYYCDNLTSITIPSSVTSIEDDAFEFCSGLTSITIPSSVTSIGAWTFACSGLTSITIPNSVTSIGYCAFGICSGLTSISVESGNTTYDSRDNCNAIINSTTNELILGCKNTTIPSNVTSIGTWAFYGCNDLISITIPSSVTSIGDGAFNLCRNLTSITIPSGVTYIGDNAFVFCSGLTSISVESGNTTYDSRDNCNAIINSATNELILGCKNTTIPSSVTSIGDDAFNECDNLTSITIPSSVTSIGDGAFEDCSGLTSITIPNSVTSIGDWAFCGCSGLTSMTILNKELDLETSDLGFKWNDETESYEAIDGFVIYGYRGSTAKTYATEHNILFMALEDVDVMYRLYNPNSGEHFYTANGAEKDMLVGLGWNYEGVAWTAPKTGNPVYRLYNPNSGDHHYTPNEAEKDMLVGVGWNYEGIGWYSAGDTPLYRLYNPNCTGAGSHHYTTNAAERDYLVSLGWNDEGIGWYGLK